jgi:uncharacterized protein YcnI
VRSRPLHLWVTKIAIFSCLVMFLFGVSMTAANAHVEIQLRGYSDKAGDESMIWLRAEHGCMYKNLMYPTQQLQVKVPNAAGRPKPEYKYGFTATVVDSKVRDSTGIPSYYTVTWKAQNSSFAIDGTNYFEVGMLTSWGKKPQMIYMPAIQFCHVTTLSNGVATKAASKDVGKALYLKWIVTTGSTPKNTSNIEYGPAPVITTKK